MKSDYAPINGLKIYYEIHSANPARVRLVASDLTDLLYQRG